MQISNISRLILYGFLFFSSLNCRINPIPESGITEFSSNFDEVSSLEELFPEDISGWTNIQLVEPTGDGEYILEEKRAYLGENAILLQDERYYSPPNAIQFIAPPTDDTVSKANIERGELYFRAGDELWCSFYVYIEGNSSIENMFLLDIETNEFRGSPGRRIQLSGSDEIILEAKGRAGDNHRQGESKINLPKNQWVNIVVFLSLSSDEDGQAKIWQDGELIVEGEGKNIIDDKTVYNRIQVGLTANSSTQSQTIYIDDFQISANSLAP